MRCKQPILIKDSKGYLQEVPCGQCIHCRLNYARMWSIRITHEQLKYGENCCFLTLTYDDEHLPEDLSIHKRELQLFLKRFRKELGRKIRYFGCGEYGDLLGRPHYHLIVFGVSVDDPIFLNRHIHYEKGKRCGWHADLKSWNKGKVHIGTVTSDSANYVAGYVVKKQKGDKYYYAECGIEPPFVLMSRNPGIGSDYIFKRGDYYEVHRFVTLKGVKYPLPRFYVDRLGKKIDVDLVKKYREEQEEKIRKLRDSGMSFSEVSRFLHDEDVQAEKNTLARFSLKRR